MLQQLRTAFLALANFRQISTWIPFRRLQRIFLFMEKMAQIRQISKEKNFK
jgi:hypothetical protein